MAVVLALDPGERRTGIAISDPTGSLATPLSTHDRKRDRSLVEQLRELCREREVQRILVGWPVTQGGERGESALRSEKLAQVLADALGLPVELVDERYTSAEASRILAGRGAPKERRDAVAAALLLQTWLDSHRESDS